MGLGRIISPVIKKRGKVITQLFGALVRGRSDFEAIKPFRDGELIRQSLGLDTAFAAETVRIYLDKTTETTEQVEGLAVQLQECSNRLLSKVQFTPVKTKRKAYIPCNIDTSPMNNEGTKKENIGYTRKGFYGYHPIFAYLGAEGYLLSCQMRPGSRHCRNGTPEFLKGIAGALPKTAKDKELLFRLDSGNDSIQTLEALPGKDEKEARETVKNGRNIIIKRDLRQEDKHIWLDLAKEYGRGETIREGKIRYTGKLKLDCTVTNRYPGVDVVFEVIERTIDRCGRQLMIADIEANTFWSTVQEKAETVIELYHDRGTVEQFHGELKTDMDLERFLSGKYAFNQIILLIGMCAHNALRAIGRALLNERELLPLKVKEGTIRKRLIHVIRYIIQMAGKLVRHSGRLVFKIYDGNEWLPVFRKLHRAFQEL